MTASTPSEPYALDWSTLAFASKAPLRSLHATFIPAPRELSEARIKKLIRDYLPKGNIVIGVACEPYVLGLEQQPHFRTLQISQNIQALFDQVNAASPKHKVYTLRHSQRDTKHILEKGKFSQVLLINGSWHFAFHHKEEFYTLANYQIPYSYISPFVNEAEAQAYEQRLNHELQVFVADRGRPAYTTEEMLLLARQSAVQSYDYCFQTGVALGKKLDADRDAYHLLATAYNKVVPYQTFAMHHGSIREANYSPANDLNYYDTVHAEVMLLLEAQQRQLDLHSTTLFINLLPCPQCARVLTQADIAELIYMEDHSAGYAVAMLEKAGKKVKRHVPAEQAQARKE